jgi:hypothetical protein
MFEDRLLIMRAQFDLDADHVARKLHQFQQRCVKNQRTAVRHAGLDDQCRLRLPHDLLKRDHVLRILHDRAAQPAEIQVVLVFEGLGVQRPHRRDNLGIVGHRRNALRIARIVRIVTGLTHERSASMCGDYSIVRANHRSS